MSFGKGGIGFIPDRLQYVVEGLIDYRKCRSRLRRDVNTLGELKRKSGYRFVKFRNFVATANWALADGRQSKEITNDQMAAATQL